MERDAATDFIEARLVETLPPALAVAIDRSSFARQLAERESRNHQEISAFFPPNAKWRIIAAGDWHAGKRSVVIQSRDDRIAMKSRDPSVERLLHAQFATLAQMIPLAVAIPALTPGPNYFQQPYVAEDTESCTHPRILGQLLALVLWFGLTDLHPENIILSQGRAHLIDADCAFFFKPALSSDRRLKASGLFPVEGDRWHGKFQPPAARIKEVLAETKTTLDHLHLQVDDTFYEMAAATSPRRVLLDTRVYMRFMQQRYFHGWDDAATRARWLALDRRSEITPAIKEAEISAMLGWNVPYFSQRGEILSEASAETPVSRRPHFVPSLRRHHHRLLQSKAIVSDARFVASLQRLTRGRL